MPKYWIAVASKEHVVRGISGGFCQVCHGKCGPLRRMKEGDLIIYYSPTVEFGGKAPYRKFTALGKISGKEPYSFRMNDDFVPWRRAVSFMQAQDAAIEPLIDKLTFIHDKKRWGFPFRRGCFSISFEDFSLISESMGVPL